MTERVYLGFKKDPRFVYNTIKLFNARKEEIYRVFENFPLLNSGEKKKALKYLDEFYEIINDDRSVKSVFLDGARIPE